MDKVQWRWLLFFGLAAFLVSCGSSKKVLVASPGMGISSLHFLGGYEIPYNLPYNATTVGGLSGIDYDPGSQTYYMICDDRSHINPARFYTAKIDFTRQSIDTVYFTGVHALLQPDGTSYPGTKQDPYHTPDPEAMRYNPVTRQLIWSSEGERIEEKGKDTIIEDPAVIMMSAEGKYIDSFVLPTNLKSQVIEKGPRQNGVFEGLTFADNYTTLYVSVEEPLFEDGPQAAVEEKKAYVRILKFDMGTKKCARQFAYKLDKVPYPPVPATGYVINGIPDILSLGGNKMLTIERAYSTGRIACDIKVFITDLTGATDVTDMPLKNAEGRFALAQKKLLLNMDSLGIYIDNIEGVTFGPSLPNGHMALLFIADNNFNAKEKAQVLLFEVIP